MNLPAKPIIPVIPMISIGSKLSSSEALAKRLQLSNLFDRYRKRYEAQMASIQLRCQHTYKFEPDPSGNNDSEYTCVGCGKRVKRLP